MIDDNTLEALKRVLVKNISALVQYGTVIERIRDERLVELIGRIVDVRRGFLQDSHKKLRAEGVDISPIYDNISVMPPWMDFSGYKEGSPLHGIIDECLRGEQVSVKDYKSILTDYNLPEHIESMLVEHSNRIHGFIIEMEDMVELY